MPDKVIDSVQNTQNKGKVYDEDYSDLSRDIPDDKLGDKEAEEVEDKTKEIEEEDEEKEDIEDNEDTEKDEDEENEDDEETKRNELYHRPTVKEIKAEFPEFFTKFPSLRDALFREIEYTKLFPTIDDAKDAIIENEAFSTMSEAALSGDSGPIIESLDKTDKKALETFCVSFLPEVYKRNQELYYTMVTPLFEGMLKQAFKSNNEDLKNSATNIANFLFGEDGEAVLSGKKTFIKNTNISEEQKKLNEQREQENSKKFRECANEVSVQVQKVMRSLIIKELDPDKEFTPFIRDQVAEEVVRRIDQALVNDNAHKQIMGARWRKAKSNGYTDDEKSKLVSAYLARAKSLIGPIKDKVRKEALGSSSEQRREKIKRSVVDKEVPISQGRGREDKNKGKRDINKMTDLEVLSS